MATTGTLQKLRRGDDASAYPPNGIRVTIAADLAAVAAGSQRTIVLADASNLPRGTDSDDPGIISVVQQGAEYSYLDTYYNWESIEDNVLINASCLTGAAVAAGSIGKVAADALYLEEIRAILETLETTDITLAGNISSLSASFNALSVALDSEAEIIAALADAAGHDELRILPKLYTFNSTTGSPLLTADNKKIVAVPGYGSDGYKKPTFLMNDSTKLSTGRVIGTTLHREATSLRVQLNNSTGVITGATGAADWSAVASAAGAILCVGGSPFGRVPFSASNKTTITPASSEYGASGIYWVTDGYQQRAVLAVPVRNLEMEGALSIIAGSGHTGNLVDLRALMDSDCRGLQIEVTPASAITDQNIIDYQHAINSYMPRISMHHKEYSYSGYLGHRVINGEFSQNCKFVADISHLEINTDSASNTDVWILTAGYSFAPQIMADSHVRYIRANNTGAGSMTLYLYYLGYLDIYGTGLLAGGAYGLSVDSGTADRIFTFGGGTPKDLSW